MTEDSVSTRLSKALRTRSGQTAFRRLTLTWFFLVNVVFYWYLISERAGEIPVIWRRLVDVLP